MKTRTLTTLAGLGTSLILCAESGATYLGLGVRVHSPAVTVAGVPRTVYRVYALFNNVNDYVVSISGSDIVGNVHIQNTNASGFGLGTGFFNAGVSTTSPLTSSGVYFNPNSQWDTFCTIGQDRNGTDVPNSTNIFPLAGWPGFISANNLDNNNIAWFTQGPQEAGRAGGVNGITQAVWFNDLFFGGPVPGANGAMGILLMQLTVNAGQNVRGTVSVGGRNAGPPEFTFQSNGQTFATHVPGPTGLSLLGLAGLMASRRRRA